MTPGLPSLFPSIHEKPLANLINDLRRPATPYDSPWRGAPTSPWNMKSRKRYSGINSIALAKAQKDAGYKSSRWGTRRQIEAMGGIVRPHEHGTMIYFGTRRHYGSGMRSRGIYCQFLVFNFEQTDGLASGQRPPLPSHAAMLRYRALTASVPFRVQYGGNSAFYDPMQDFIQLPDPGAFYYPENDLPRTWLHEVAHASMIPSRLNIPPLGDHALARYAWCEITAEMAAAFVLAQLKISASVDSSNYIADWHGCTKSDKVLEPVHEAVLQVADDAMLVADYILAFER